ncbi:unnamed protein product, partial [Rotaria magnacalcarata]
ITENNETGCSKVGELHVQGLVNLADNREEDGGFWLVPGFHKYLTQWADNHRHLRRFYGHYDQFIMIDRQYIPKLYDAACHISSRAGSAILWDQRAIHGSRPNRSQSPRYAQFIKMFPADHSAMTLERAEKRRNVIIEKLQTVNINPEADLSSLVVMFHSDVDGEANNCKIVNAQRLLLVSMDQNLLDKLVGRCVVLESALQN